MNKTTFPKGSEWRKWDLHVHTPASIISNYGSETPEVWDKFICELENLPKEFKVLGINDYVFVDGYERLLNEKKNNNRLTNIDLLLPVVEFRIEKFSGVDFGIYKRINLHVIFSNELTIETIKSQFLNTLAQSYLISDGNQWKRAITKESIEELGKKIKQSVPKEELVKYKSDLIEGFNNLNIKEDQIFKSLENDCFKGKYLIAIGKTEWDSLKWSDTSIATKKNIINSADIVFTAAETIEAFNKAKKKLQEQNVKDLLLDCSDAHSFSDSQDKDRIGNCFNWLKADPTFEGLKQVAKESTRIFIGDLPPLLKRVKENSQRYIKKLSFSKLSTPTLNETWFENVELEFNPGLVAIIGNKGMGKSALADTIGLLGNTPNYNHFSFLNDKKFKKGIPNRAASFKATLNWESGLLPEIKLLSEVPHTQSIEKVKYLPQGYLEVLCNENHSNFLNELRNVIFTYIPEEKRYGKNNLEELERFTTDLIEKEIRQISSDIQNINKQIIDLEKKDTDSYKAQIESNLNQKNTDLEAHKLTLPPIVNLPTDKENLEKAREVNESIEIKKKQVSDLELSLSENKIKKSETLLSKTNLEKVLTSLTLFENEYTKTKEEIVPTLSANGINIDEVIKLTIEREKVITKIKEKLSQLEALDNLVNPELHESIPFKISELNTQLLELKNTLDEPSRVYQKYLSDKEAWEKTKISIIGDAKQLGTIKYYENELSFIANKLAEDLSIEIGKRKDYLKKLINKKFEILNSFKSFYQPITDFFSKEGNILKEYEIKLDVENKLIGFEDKFFTQISSGAKGSFYGSEDARKKLLEIIQLSKWETEDDIISFLDIIIDNLKFDRRPNNNEKREVDKQLKSDYTVEGLYNFLFTLDYLKPTYKLKLNEKNIDELSPGERGALLLIFYLALDRNDIPLVIDQPEENLDNQSVYILLAQFIKSAKQKRQVIIVTHNPNLAVVCDSDQYIHVRIEKHNKNKVTVKSGSLENPEINKAVVDILEGTYDAFDTRDTKYKVIPRQK